MMRELNECKAEVFRRSENRIQERKKIRNRVLAWCIPLCLIGTIWSVTILPAMPSQERKNEAAPEQDAVNEKSDASIFCSYVKVEVQNASAFPTFYREETDTVKVSQIYAAIFPNVCNTPEELSPTQDGGETDVEEAPVYDILPRYIITFSTEEGTQTVYYLQGNVLTEKESGATAVLNDSVMEELMTRLELPEKGD